MHRFNWSERLRPATPRSAGLVSPQRSWLSASIDYYNIKKSKVIAASDTGSALDNYFAGLPQPIGVTVVPDSPDAQFPAALPRPIEVIGTYINANSLKTDGIDLDLRANFDFGRTQYISELNGTEIFNYALILPDGSRQSYVGTHGPYNLSSGAGTPPLPCGLGQYPGLWSGHRYRHAVLHQRL